MVMMVVLEEDHRLLMRTTSLPAGKLTPGEIDHPQFKVVEARETVWVQMISTSPVDQLEPSQISQWCEAIQRTFVDLAKEGQTK